jgi:hypothetical protein
MRRRVRLRLAEAVGLLGQDRNTRCAVIADLKAAKWKFQDRLDADKRAPVGTDRRFAFIQNVKFFVLSLSQLDSKRRPLAGRSRESNLRLIRWLAVQL